MGVEGSDAACGGQAQESLSGVGSEQGRPPAVEASGDIAGEAQVSVREPRRRVILTRDVGPRRLQRLTPGRDEPQPSGWSAGSAAIGA